jgi:hypothetical protein
MVGPHASRGAAKIGARAARQGQVHGRLLPARVRLAGAPGPRADRRPDRQVPRLLRARPRPHEVERYGHYFLGSVVISHKRGQRFVVDGQQRLTTLTLLLIYLHHLQADRDGRVDVRNLIFSEKFGRKSFNLDVPDRAKAMQRSARRRGAGTSNGARSSRSATSPHATATSSTTSPRRSQASALPFFIDWLLENVHLVEIEAYSDEDAYTIFETMNDRGLSLSLPDMLKGYVLANIGHEEDQRAVNALWKGHMQRLRELGEEEDVDFFKDWLRARHAETIRPARRGRRTRTSSASARSSTAGCATRRTGSASRPTTSPASSSATSTSTPGSYPEIRRAATARDPGWEAIRYNADRGFTLQTQAMLAPLEPGRPAEVVRRKIAWSRTSWTSGSREGCGTSAPSPTRR